MSQSDVQEQKQKDPTMLLSAAPNGQRLRISGIRSGKGLRARLSAMGIMIGAEIEVIGNTGHGPCIVSVMGSRVMLGRGMCEAISGRPI